MIKIIISLVSIFLMWNTNIFAEKNVFERESFGVHILGGIQYNIYNSDFSTFQNMVDCGVFTGGGGVGSSVFLFIEKPLTKNFHPAIGFGMNDKSGKMTIDNHFYSRSSESFDAELVRTENSLTLDLNYFEIVPGLNYLITEDFFTGNLRFFSGFKISFINNNNFTQTESIISPENAVFINDNTQSRQITINEISSANRVLYGLNLALENMIKVGNNHNLTQRISLDYMFNDITQDAQWKHYALRFELGFRFGMAKRERPVKPTPAPMPAPPEPVEPAETELVEIAPEPEIDIFISEEKSSFRLYTGNELLSTVPIVNAIFFETNSTEIPDYYKTNDSGIDYFQINPVEAHQYILPRIANILKKNPDAELTLESSISDIESDAGLELSRNRAKNVKSALESLGVSNTININAGINPGYPSNQEYYEGKLENQRVMLILKNAQLQEYVDIQTYAEIFGTLGFEADVENLRDNITVNNNFNNDILIINASDDFEFGVSERIRDKTELPLIISYSMDDNIHKDTLIVNINDLEKEVIELNLNNFEAILRFNYNSSELSSANQLLLLQLIDKLPDGSTIEILGSADDLGSALRNKELELERATNTERFIKSNTNKTFNITTGANPVKFDESTPQGRFLNRSIIIKVK